LNVESYLELKVLELLRFKVRGSAASTLAKRLRTSEEKLSHILESMVEDGKYACMLELIALSEDSR